MNKHEILDKANRGKQRYSDGEYDFDYEVFLRYDSDCDAMISIKLYPVNEYTTSADFGGGWLKYYAEEEFATLLTSMKRIVDKMKLQETIVKSRHTLRLIDLNKEDYHCNHLLKNIDTNRKYIKQDLKSSDASRPAFQVLTCSKWYGGYEPSCPVNINIELEGKRYVPKWSFWLDSAYYEEEV